MEAHTHEGPEGPGDLAVETNKDDFEQWEAEMNVTNVVGEKMPIGRYAFLGKCFEWVRNNLYKNETDDRFKKIIEENWTGKISVKERDLRARQLTREALRPENLARYYVEADPHAPTRCIDGRCQVCYGEEGCANLLTPLGAQVPGGSATAALCFRAAGHDSIYSKEQTSLSADIGALNEKLAEVGFGIGGHTGRNWDPDGDRTGCGAIDHLPEILARITNPAALIQVRKLTKAILGEKSYKTNMVDALVGRLVAIQGQAKDYLGKDEDNDTYAYRKESIKEILKLDQKSVIRLDGDHHEAAFIVNLVPGTTFHTDQFSADNNHQIQAFNYDFWRTEAAAAALFPTNDKQSKKERRRTLGLQKRFVTVRAMFAVATAMVLTDGSLDLIVRTS